MPRLFTGIEVPPGVAAALAALRGGLPRARWIGPENYHLTLRFVGDVDMVQAEAAFPGFLRQFLTHPIDGLENYDEMFDALTNAKDAIKVYCVVAKTAWEA